MTTIQEQRTLLTQPFPAEYIQTVPKAGRNLQYVSHGRVTERLNDVDPEWTWEPLGYKDDGTPAITKSGRFVNLWIKLTVLGVTRIGVGTVELDNNGNSSHDISKELISDALRNAAMRFGVGLHLWLNDVGERAPVQNAPSAPQNAPAAPQPASLGDRIAQVAPAPAAPPAPQYAETGEKLTEGQGRMLYRLWHHVLHWDRERYLQECELVLSTPVSDDRSLTKNQASQMIRSLKLRAGEPVDDEAPQASAPSSDPGPAEPPLAWDEPF